MESIPMSGLDELDKHLDELAADPTLQLQPKLFDDVELQLTEANIPPLIPRLLPKLTQILTTYTHDPAPIASLSSKLLGPITFTQILTLASEDAIIQALRSPAASVNLLAMTILHKAAASPSDAAILAAMGNVVAAFVRRWLAAPQVEVGEKGSRVLGDVLDVDCELPPSRHGMANGDSGPHSQITLRRAPGQGAMWRRVFQDRAIYGLIIDLCSGHDADTANASKQLSLAQGRLLRILPRLAALNLTAVSAPSQITDGGRMVNGTSTASSSSGGRRSLLQFAALDMVDKSDVLMALSVVDFFEAFVSITRVSPDSPGKIVAIRTLLRDAMADDDDMLKVALLSLPDRTVPEEADDLRRWLREILPGGSSRVAQR